MGITSLFGAVCSNPTAATTFARERDSLTLRYDQSKVGSVFYIYYIEYNF